jgi:hypothetical protein
VNSRGTPKVSGGHTLDERANLWIYSGTPTLGPATPSPVPAKTCPMPPDDRARFDDNQRFAPACPPTREQHPQLAVDIGQPRPLDGALQDPELVAQGKDLNGQLLSGSEEGEAGKDQGLEKVQHGQAAWSGSTQTSTTTHWYGFSGGTTEFDRVAKGAGVKVVRTAVRAPLMNATCERYFGSVRRDCLDHIIILGRRHLAQVLRIYTRDYFNRARPHQGIGQRFPVAVVTENFIASGTIRSVPILGGLHHDYRVAA